jgi:hypothetical protein
MGLVPHNRAFKAKFKCGFLEEDPYGVFGRRPVKAGSYAESLRFFCSEERNKVDSEAVLVVALPRPRFGRTPALLEQVVLPVGRAEALIDLETELRAVGMIGVMQVCLQSPDRPDHFRVETVYRPDNSDTLKLLRVQHDLILSLKAGGHPCPPACPSGLGGGGPRQGGTAKRPFTGEAPLAAKGVSTLRSRLLNQE